MTEYKYLFFDLDNTILDFSASERKAVKGLLDKHGIGGTDERADRYSKINQMYWEMYERKEIEKEEIFSGRYKTFLETEGIDYDYMKLSDDYFNFLSEGHDMVDGAMDILLYCKSRGYVLCATTNGVSRTQYKRIALAKLDEVFDYIVVSEDAGFQKPTHEYFDYAIKKAEITDKSKILIIGDSQSSDILGGINSGIDTCWYNPKGALPKYESKYQIGKLSDLEEIL